MISKVKTLVWLFNHKYFKQSMLLFSRSLFKNKKEDTRLEASEWCKSIALTSKEAYLRITQNDANYVDVNKVYKNIIDQSSATADSCPVKMGGPGDMNILYNLAEYLKAKSMIETGVAYGWSSLALLLSINQREGSKLISTDMPYAKLNNDDYVGCVVPNYLKRNWKLIRLPDIDGLPVALKEAGLIDLCHYDSDKSYAGRMWAYPKLWQVLRPNGIFISDDIGDNLAFKEFSEQVDGDPLVIKYNNQYVGLIKKR